MKGGIKRELYLRLRGIKLNRLLLLRRSSESAQQERAERHPSRFESAITNHGLLCNQHLPAQIENAANSEFS
jgi:hypothetical protein